MCSKIVGCLLRSFILFIVHATMINYLSIRQIFSERKDEKWKMDYAQFSIIQWSDLDDWKILICLEAKSYEKATLFSSLFSFALSNFGDSCHNNETLVSATLYIVAMHMDTIQYICRKVKSHKSQLYGRKVSLSSPSSELQNRRWIPK